MAVPIFQKFYVPFLDILSDQKIHELSQIRKEISEKFDLSEEDLNQLTPGRQLNVFRNRVGWSATYLKKAELINSPKKAHYVITELGIKMLEKYPYEITNSNLMELESFRKFKSSNNHWTEIYEELADKLLEFKDNREQLLLDLKNAYNQIGLKQSIVNSREPVRDIDPFSFFDKVHIIV